MGGHAGVWSRDPDAPDPNAPGATVLRTQVHDAFGVGMNESIPMMPPGGSGGGFGGTTENGPYATSAGPLRWRGVEGSRSGFDLGGLVEMQARSYDPTIGRFLQADSLPMAPLTTQGMNRHIYCENDPVNRTDPLGLFGLWDGLTIVGATISIIAGIGLMMAGPMSVFAGMAMVLVGAAALASLFASLADSIETRCSLARLARWLYFAAGIAAALQAALSGGAALAGGANWLSLSAGIEGTMKVAVDLLSRVGGLGAGLSLVGRAGAFWED